MMIVLMLSKNLGEFFDREICIDKFNGQTSKFTFKYCSYYVAMYAKTWTFVVDNFKV